MVLYEPKVPPFREAAAAAHAVLSGSVDLDANDPATEGKLNDASVVIAVGQKAFNLAKSKVPKTPIVFCMVLGINRSSLTTFVTGVPMEPDPTETLAAIQLVRPGTTRVGLVYNPASSELFAAEAVRGAAKAGVTLVTKAVTGPDQVRDAVKEMASSIDVLWLPPDAHLFSKELFLALLSFSAERNLPLIGFLDSFTQAGALASISADYSDIGTRAGKLADDILLHPETKRSPVPGMVFSPGKLSINMKTAEALGVKVPANAVSAAKQKY
jgi:putative ABC transport system substrate-binding protein